MALRALRVLQRGVQHVTNCTPKPTFVVPSMGAILVRNKTGGSREPREVPYSSLKGKVILITGASSGIGEETAVQFASHGSSVVLGGRNLDNLTKTAQRCEAAGLDKKQILIARCDVTKQDDVTGVVDKTISTFGQLNVLVNNAGILVNGRFQESSIDDYHRVMDTNVKGLIMVTQQATPHLIKSKGNIVNVSSFSGTRPTFAVIFYAMSKAAVDHMTACLAQDLGTQGVRVNSVNPGVIKTEVHVRSGMSQEQYGNYLDMQKWLNPVGRYGEADEVAKAITFLASDEASFINGAIVPLDGGRLWLTPRNASGPLI